MEEGVGASSLSPRLNITVEPWRWSKAPFTIASLAKTFSSLAFASTLIFSALSFAYFATTSMWAWMRVSLACESAKTLLNQASKYTLASVDNKLPDEREGANDDELVWSGASYLGEDVDFFLLVATTLGTSIMSL